MTEIEADFSKLPRVEDYRADLSPDEIAAAQAANTRSIAVQGALKCC